MKDLHGILHGTEWLMFHALLDNALGPSNKKDGSTAKLGAVANH